MDRHTEISPTVTTPTGRITGVFSDDGQRRHFYSVPYSDISGPFADAELRRVNGDIDATTPQTDSIALTVTSPTDATDGDDLPVIVFIHGGAFEEGSQDDPRHDARATVSEGFVQVNIGYRKKLPGFAQFRDDAPAHFRGVHDCLVALEWIQHNIESFGGDPTNVTISGQSAGANLVLWLCRPDHYRGSFRRAVALSPASPRAGFAKRKPSLRVALGKPVTRRALSQLSDAKLDRGYRRFRLLYPSDIPLGPPLDELDDLVDIPIWISVTREEFHHHPVAALDSPSWLRSMLPARPLRQRFARHLQLTGDFSAWQQFHESLDPTRLTGQLLTDAFIHRWAAVALTHTTGPTWLSQSYRDDGQSVAHSADISYLFGAVDPPTPASTQMHQALLRFARYNSPGFERFDTTESCWRVDLATGEHTTTKAELDYLHQAFDIT